jgi:hypothetical protein
VVVASVVPNCSRRLVGEGGWRRIYREVTRAKQESELRIHDHHETVVTAEGLPGGGGTGRILSRCDIQVDANSPASVLMDLLPRFFRSTCCWAALLNNSDKEGSSSSFKATASPVAPAVLEIVCETGVRAKREQCFPLLIQRDHAW